MKDFTTVVGLLLGLVAIVGGFVVEGGHPLSLVQFGAFLIVFGGTFAALFVQTPWPIFVDALKMLGWLFRTPVSDPEEWIAKAV